MPRHLAAEIAGELALTRRTFVVSEVRAHGLEELLSIARELELVLRRPVTAVDVLAAAPSRRERAHRLRLIRSLRGPQLE